MGMRYGSTFEERGEDPLVIPASNEQRAGGRAQSPDCSQLRGIVVVDSVYGSVHA
jgi:hypothetical protein